MTPNSLAATGLTVGYGETPVLQDLDFCVPQGRFTAIIGPNGCGKSTLVKSLARVLTTQPGMVTLDGKKLQAYRPRHLAQRVALLPQHPTVPDGVTVRSLVARGRYPYHGPLRQWSPNDTPAIEQALDDTGLSALRISRLPHYRVANANAPGWRWYWPNKPTTCSWMSQPHFWISLTKLRCCGYVAASPTRVAPWWPSYTT